MCTTLANWHGCTLFVFPHVSIRFCRDGADALDTCDPGALGAVDMKLSSQVGNEEGLRMPLRLFLGPRTREGLLLCVVVAHNLSDREVPPDENTIEIQPSDRCSGKHPSTQETPVLPRASRDGHTDEKGGSGESGGRHLRHQPGETLLQILWRRHCAHKAPMSDIV